MNPLPATVKIGAITYELIDAGPDFDPEEINGEMLFVDALDMPRTKARGLVADLLRMVWDDTALHEFDSRDRAVMALGNGLAAVWRENPELFAWIEGALVHGEDPKRESLQEVMQKFRGKRAPKPDCTDEP